MSNNKGPSWIPHVRILFFADFSGTNLLPVSPGGILRYQEEEFGLRILKDILEASVFPSISVDLVNRFWTLNDKGGIDDGSQANTTNQADLSSARLKNYDEVWFFGQHLENFTNQNTKYSFQDTFTFPDLPGYEFSELLNYELQALEDWMNRGGGVLMLGDHSNPSTTGKLYNLGRALGQNVIRAGKMRIWEGPPGGYLDPINTSGDTPDMTWMPNQEDSVPQDIFPVSWDIVFPGFAARYWHSLFVGSMDLDGLPAIIRVMPDHGHEGALDTPKTFDSKEWPMAGNGFQPKPETVAYGRNKATSNIGVQGSNFDTQRFDLISAYDGHVASVGRIVAHTTWHHYINVNLHGFINLDGSFNDALQSISEYYRNVASWLMPLAHRTQSLIGMLRWLPDVRVIRDLSGAPFELLGSAALKVLRQFATGGQIQDLIFHGVQQVIAPTKERRTEQLPLPSVAYLLGGMVTELQRDPKVEECDIVANGIRCGLRTRMEELEAGAKAMHGLLEERD